MSPSSRSHSGHSTPGPLRTVPSFRTDKDSHSPVSSRSRSVNRKRGRDTLEPPSRDEDFVKETYRDVYISTPIADNPKNSLANFTNQVLSRPLDFNSKEGMLNGQKLWR